MIKQNTASIPRRIITPAGFLAFLFSQYNQHSEALQSIPFQTMVAICLLFILIAFIKNRVLVSKPALIITGLCLSTSILCSFVTKETIATASTIAFSFLLLVILIKKYDKLGLNYFFKQLVDKQR